MRFNKVYIPRDAIARHEDFDTWYEDGDLFYHFEGDWQTEKDRIAIIGRMGGEVACIKPDHLTLTYYLRLERWEHCFHPYTIFKHYYVEGMLWDIYGSFADPPFDFITESHTGDDMRDGHVKLVNFRNKGECFEVRVRDLNKLRMAVITVVAMGIKEEYKGLSEGEEKINASRWEKLKGRIFTNKGFTYDQILAEEKLQEARKEVLKNQS